ESRRTEADPPTLHKDEMLEEFASYSKASTAKREQRTTFQIRMIHSGLSWLAGIIIGEPSNARRRSEASPEPMHRRLCEHRSTPRVSQRICAMRTSCLCTDEPPAECFRRGNRAERH